ncbi:MAG: hypothetical protein IT223_05920 [Crocinitomicaceae bacterium]|nr:hypothetical protein [Crocinitomicaceae bacterium]
MQDHKEKRTLYILYILGFYILVQLCWWGYSLISVHREVYVLTERVAGHPPDETFEKKIWMIIGEGSVFILLLGIGFWKILQNIAHTRRLAMMEKTFLLSVTHELKTPIAAVKLFLETLRSRKLTPEQQETILNDALRETLRLQSLSENILLTTRLDHNKENAFTEFVDLSAMIKTEAVRYTQLMMTRQSFDLQLEEGIGLSGDGSLLRSAINNLIENAVKYAPHDSRIVISLYSHRNTIHLSIADEGPGILPEDTIRVFEKFYRTGNEQTRKHKGTGLGLYIVKSIVKLHKGRITVSPNSPHGSIFKIELPIDTKADHE